MSEETSFSGMLDAVGDLDDAVTSRPAIADNTIVNAKIVDFTKRIVETSEGSKEQLVVHLETQEKVQSEPGLKGNVVDIDMGYRFQDSVLLEPVGKWTAESTKNKLAQIKNAVLGHHNGPFNTDELLGQNVAVKVVVNASKNGSVFNNVALWIEKE